MDYFKGIFSNIRFYVLCTSSIVAGSIYFWTATTFQGEGLQIINLTQTYALAAVIYLYFTLMASPLVRIFPGFPFRSKYIKARRALGVSAFFFGLIHACFAFFGELGGFRALPFLNSTYLIAITLSSLALLILTLMALTSFDFAIDKLGFRKWKFLHRFVYLAGFFIIVHALMLGSSFTDLSGAIPQVFGTALAILLILESIRLDRYLVQKFPSFPKIGISLIVTIAFLVFSFFWLAPS